MLYEVRKDKMMSITDRNIKCELIKKETQKSQ